MKIRILFVSLFLLFFSVPQSSGQFFSLETEKLRLIYYSAGHEYVVPHLARSFENALQFHEKTFDYRSREKITILLEDFGDYGNAGAISMPTNYIKVSLAPFSFVYEIRPSNERMNWMMNHELVHIVASDHSAGQDRFFRTLFLGKVFPYSEDPLTIGYSYLTTPREYAPRWYHEGAAVFMETWMAGGLGRAMGPYDEMVFRTKVRDNARIYDIIGLESEGTTIDFQVGANSYLYGTRFLNYLGYQHGPEKLVNWIARHEDSRMYYSAQFKSVYGQSIDDEWRDWIQWEHQWQNANLDSIREFPVTHGRPLTKTALGSVSRSFIRKSNQKILTAIRYPGQMAHLAEIDPRTGDIEKITDIKGAALYFVTSLAYDPKTETAFYTTNNYGWRDLVKIDLNSGDETMLIKEARVGDLAFNKQDSSLWGVRHFNGISTLVRIPFPYTEWKQVYSFPYGEDLYDIDISPDGQLITGALSKNNGIQHLIMMNTADLLNGNFEHKVLFDFEVSSPANFSFSDDGQYIYGSSYYSGVSNIYRYNLKISDIDILSNAETGFFRPVPFPGDSLIVFEYTGEGFIPVMIGQNIPERVGAIEYLGTHSVNRHPQLRQWTLGSPREIELDSITTYRGAYNTLGNLNVNSLVPIVQGYKHYTALGFRLDMSDALGLSALNLRGSYAPAPSLAMEERFHASINFSHWNWKFFGSYNPADFYDLFGPTRTSRKGFSLGGEYTHTLLYDEPKRMDLNFFAEGYAGLERLPDYQNVVATYSELLTTRVSLDYEFVQKSLGSVDEEKGIRWQLAAQNDYVNKKFIFLMYNNFDFGIPLPIDHSSVWLRTSLGYSFGASDDPFANFFFGGFGNNWIDHLSEKRYRRHFSFPGAKINEFGGKNYAKMMLEWNLPPVRFRNLGFPVLYFNWLRPAFFATAIQTNIDDTPAREPLPQYGSRRTLFNLGAQIDLRLVLFSNLSSTLSLGFARAVEGDVKATDEFMISLKIM